MEFKNHSSLKGTHAPFSASQSSWLRYDPEKFEDKLFNVYRSALGTEIHDFASSQIILGHRYRSPKILREAIETYIYRKFYNEDYEMLDQQGTKLLKNLPKLNPQVFDTVIQFVNDSIGYKMHSEQTLFYSQYFYGTADAISFDEKNKALMIFDLKTGVNPAHMDQLEVYAALFCLEYGYRPSEISIELRLYQNGEIVSGTPDVDNILNIMNIMIEQTKCLTELDI